MHETNRTSPASHTPQDNVLPNRSVAAFGLWLRTAIAGAGIALVALAGGWNGELSPGSALALLVVSVAVAVFAALRVRAWLAQSESATPVVAGVGGHVSGKSHDAELALQRRSRVKSRRLTVAV